MTASSKPGTARLTLNILNGVAPAVENLACNQEQCDQDGVMVKVSRQALDEVLNAVNEVALQAAMNASPSGLATKPDGGVERHAYELEGHEMLAANEASSASESGGQTHLRGAGIKPGPSGPAGGEELGRADFARRCRAYLDDAPMDGRHSDAAGSNAYELIEEAIEHCKPSAPAPVGEPVAWQGRKKSHPSIGWTGWFDISDAECQYFQKLIANGSNDVEVRALYTAPPVTASVEEVAQAQVDLASAINEALCGESSDGVNITTHLAAKVVCNEKVKAAILALLSRKEGK